MAGTRDFIVHNYASINTYRLRRTIPMELPPFKQKCEEIINEIERNPYDLNKD